MTRGTDRRFKDTTAQDDFADGTVVDGVFRWNSNNAVPHEDMLEDFVDAGLMTQSQLEFSVNARKADMQVFAKQYREQQAKRSAEQIAEERFGARAAHGEGVTLVNVITGEKWTT